MKETSAGVWLDDDATVLLHGVAVVRTGRDGGLPEYTGLTTERIYATLPVLHDTSRLVSHGDVRLVTPAGERHLRSAYDRAYAHIRRNALVSNEHESFEEINAEAKDAIARWQQVDIGGSFVPNDHSDDAYDGGIVAELREIVSALPDRIPALLRLAPWLEFHVGRARYALERVEVGDTDYVSSVRLPSLHSVWFELHEDILRTLGRARPKDA